MFYFKPLNLELKEPIDFTFEGVAYKRTFDDDKEVWMVEDEGYELADSKTLTKLKDGVQSINFNFKDTNGKFVSLNDVQFKNKVLVVQILGT